jgi:hypothetical protein
METLTNTQTAVEGTTATVSSNTVSNNNVRNKIVFAPNKKGELITKSRNPEYGFIRLSYVAEDVIDPVTGFSSEKKYSFILKNKLDKLQATLDKNPNGLVGKLYTVEFVESEMPAEFHKLINEKIDYEDAIASYIKRAGKGGPELTLKGERIFRYTKYDNTGKANDVLVHHDNGKEVKEWRNTQKAGSAKFAE